MKKVSARISKTFQIFLLIYFFTLTLFIVDTALTAKKALSIYESLRDNQYSPGDLDDLAEELSQYATVFNSPLTLPTKLLLGEKSGLTNLGLTIEAGAKSLNTVAPSLERKFANKYPSDSEFLAGEATAIAKASGELKRAFENFQSIRFSGLLSPLNKKLDLPQTKLSKYQAAFERTSPLLPIFPELLGNFKKRTYFIAMQNSAQSRGTGGLIGTFALLSIEKGKITLDHVAPNTELQIQPDIPIQVPSEYRLIYKDYAKSWNGSNFSPHFPYAAQIWAETWRRMTGEKVDGVISIDTYLLKALLSASGPVELDGYTINSDNVIEELLSNAYIKFESSPERRKNYLADVAKTIAERFIQGNYSKISLLQNSLDPLLENRIFIYLADRRESKYLSRTALSGTLDDKPNNEYRLVLQNIAGNKLDYYIARELSIMSEKCAPIRITRVDFTVTNTASKDVPLPAYVNALRAQGFPNGNQNAQYAGIFLYGPTNSEITAVVDLDTGIAYGAIFTERNRPLYTVQVMIPAKSSKRFSIYFEGGTGRITTFTQPLVIPQKTTITDSCNE